MRKLAQPRTNFRDFIFNLLADAGIQFEKDRVEFAGEDFLVAHDTIQG
ncbi:MAG: hypothetical protein PCFJNLEI_01351 [Verrucomicrobiae bacterium]|nr:hypothetical protein [Verrucomicrobiae bacterium]